MVRQAELAFENGIHGFCFYFYWFNGHRLLERPLEQLLAHKETRLPFCICWANENWNRQWDGRANQILMAQDYQRDYAERFIRDVIPILKGPRYIKVGDAPLLLIYRVDQLPDAAETAELWRKLCREEGISRIHLTVVQSYGTRDPRTFGFDASVEFPSHWSPDFVDPATLPGIDPDFKGSLADYVAVAQNWLAQAPPPCLQYRGVMPGWDNTPRRLNESLVFVNSSPSTYQAWLQATVELAMARAAAQETLVFVNAWNEWGEGAYLEPDARDGRARLEATREGLRRGIAAAAERHKKRVARPEPEGGETGEALTMDLHATPKTFTAEFLVLNWNGVDLLREHLPSVLAAAKKSGAPVAVADNGSTDESLRFLESAYPEVQRISLGENHGFAGGYNLAMKQVPWELVALVNNDTTVAPDFLDDLLRPFLSEDAVFATSAQIAPQKPQLVLQETGRTCARFERGRLDAAHLPVTSEEGTEYVLWAGGGSALLSRQKFLALGGFDEICSPFYYENVDLSYRAWKRGWPTVFVPHCRVVHKYQGTTGRLDKGRTTSIVSRNRVLFVWLTCTIDACGSNTSCGSRSSACA
jgi:GT2 family glycosyltransferase